jgi:hypothetical protein
MNVHPDQIKKQIQRKGYYVRMKIPEELRSLEPEILMGRSVLDQAILDLIEYPSYEIKWFDSNNEDFRTICYIAYFEPEIIEEQVKTLFKKMFPDQEITTYVSAEYSRFFHVHYKVSS